MKKQLIILSTVALTISACSVFDPNNNPTTTNASTLTTTPGEYDQTVTTTDAAGTKTVKKISSQVKVDNNGNKKAVIQSKITQDPKGLLNKTTVSKTKDVVEEESGKITTSHDEEENEDTNY